MKDDAEWSEDILNRLNVRDQYEKKDSKYFKAFSQLSQEARNNDEVSNNDKSIEYNKLLKDDNQLKKENEILTSSLNQTTIALEKSDLKINQLLKSQDHLERQNTSLNNKIKHLNLEIIEKNKSVEIVNDELLLNEIHTNVLKDKITRLSDENKKLVERWIEKAKSDAEKLNDANEFLESVHRK